MVHKICCKRVPLTTKSVMIAGPIRNEQEPTANMGSGSLGAAKNKDSCVLVQGF